MLLVIDSGNTNVVFAVYEGDTQLGNWRSSNDARRTAEEYAVWLTQLMTLEDLNPKDIDGAIIANVVPMAAHNLKSLCSRYFKTEPLIVGEPGVELGIGIDMDRPEEVGADRVVNAVAAYERYGGPLIVVDFGTATSFDVVGEKGVYEGGVIAPGINLSAEALHQAAAKLPGVGVKRPKTVIGKATVPAMESGLYWGYVGLIEGLIARIKEEYGQDMTVVATGGLAPVFVEASPVITHSDPDLTLRGLRLIYETNTKDRS